MAEPILHNSPPEEPNKSESNLSEICLNGNQHQSPEIMEPIQDLDEIPPIIPEASACYLSGTADHFIGILEETVSNLTRLHEDLSKIQKMLMRGGGR
jgi:hypothetical protein